MEKTLEAEIRESIELFDICQKQKFIYQIPCANSEQFLCLMQRRHCFYADREGRGSLFGSDRKLPLCTYKPGCTDHLKPEGD